jgi:hypothetical protein
MTKLNRRKSKTSAPVPVNDETFTKLERVWLDLAEFFDALPAQEQQEVIDDWGVKRDIANKHFNNGKEVSDAVIRITDAMKIALIERQKIKL